MSFEEEIVLFIKAKSPLIYIVCAEEERVEYALRRLMTSKLKRVVYSWDFVNGFTPNVLNESYNRNPFEALSRVRNMFSQVPSLILFKDFQNFLSDLSISRELRNLLPIIRTQPKTLVFVSNQKIVPNELIDKFVFIEFGLPNVIEIEKELSRLFNTLNIHLSNEVFTLLVNSCRGLSLEKIRHLIAKSIASKKQLDFSTVDLILHEKQQIISRTEILEFWQPGEHLQDIVG